MYEKILKLEKSGLFVFDVLTIANILNIKKNSASVVIQRLMKKDILISIQRNRYVLKSNYLKDVFKTANELVKPSYISLYSALNYYGISTQNPIAIQSVTIKRGREIGNPNLNFDFKYYKLQQNLYFGYEIIDNKFIAEREKALLDIMYFQKRSLDFESIKFSEFNAEKLKIYIKKYSSYYQKIFLNNIKHGFGSNVN